MNSRIIFIFGLLSFFIGNSHVKAQGSNAEFISLLTAGVPPISISPNSGTKNIENKVPSFEETYSKTYDWDFFTKSSITPISNAIFPKFVQENPRGYSYLCRLELKIEEKFPIGVWMKFGENNGLKGVVSSPTNVRMRLLSF